MSGIRWTVMILAAAGLAAGGCGPAPPQLGKVHGKVTYKGKPLTFGSVVFMPAAGVGKAGPTGAGQPSSGDIQSDGSYALTTNAPGDGAIVGESKVVVVAIDPVTRKTVIPPKYQDAASTPLSRTVAAGENTFDIEVTD
jgi:hypothetical protein